MAINLKIAGMTCDHCERAVSQALSGVKGVDKVAGVDRESGRALVEGSPDVAELIAAVVEEGYDAEISQ